MLKEVVLIIRINVFKVTKHYIITTFVENTSKSLNIIILGIRFKQL